MLPGVERGYILWERSHELPRSLFRWQKASKPKRLEGSARKKGGELAELEKLSEFERFFLPNLPPLTIMSSLLTCKMRDTHFGPWI